MPTQDEVYDFALLAQKEMHHRGVRGADADWAEKRDLEIIAERSDGDEPRTAAAVKVQVCPIDPLATAKIEFWVSDLSVPEEELAVNLARTLFRVIDWCIANGHDRLWGWVPLSAPHLIRFADVHAGLGLSDRTSFDKPAVVEEEEDYSAGVFYVTDSSRFEECKTFLRRLG